MGQEYFYVIVGLFWIFAWVGVWLVRRRAVEARALKMREMLHRERVAAIEKGVPLPELPVESEAVSTWLDPEAERLRSMWLKRVSLVMGFVFLFTGLGICAAFFWAPDQGFHGMWTIGMIPAMAGVGFLLYAAVARWSTSSD